MLLFSIRRSGGPHHSGKSTKPRARGRSIGSRRCRAVRPVDAHDATMVSSSHASQKHVRETQKPQMVLNSPPSVPVAAKATAPPPPPPLPQQPVLARARQITARRGATRRPLPLPSVAPDDTVHTHSVADSVRLSQALAASRTCSFRRFRSPFSRRSLGARAADRIIPIP